MSANELRQAAETLRARADACTPAPWVAEDGTGVIRGNGGRNAVAEPWGVAREANAAYIATMHPGVGLAVADLLDALAEEIPNDTYPREGSAAHRLVGLINGGAA